MKKMNIFYISASILECYRIYYFLPSVNMQSLQRMISCLKSLLYLVSFDVSSLPSSASIYLSNLVIVFCALLDRCRLTRVSGFLLENCLRCSSHVKRKRCLYSRTLNLAGNMNLAPTATLFTKSPLKKEQYYKIISTQENLKPIQITTDYDIHIHFPPRKNCKFNYVYATYYSSQTRTLFEKKRYKNL